MTVLTACADLPTALQPSPAALAATAGEIPVAAHYEMDILPVLDGTTSAGAMSINDQGDVIGDACLDSPVGATCRAIVWKQGHSPELLETLGGEWSGGYSVANGLYAVGDAADERGTNRGYIWTQSSGMVAITPDQHWGTARAVNSAGSVVGFIKVGESGSEVYRPYLWTEREGIVEIGNLGGPAEANAINNRGEVVGEAKYPDGTGAGTGFHWSHSAGMRPLPSLPTGQVASAARAINNAGSIAGHVQPLDRNYPCQFCGRSVEPALWPADNRAPILLLGDREGVTGMAHGINDRQWVVGYFQEPNSDVYWERPFLWTPTDGFVELPTRGGRSATAVAINNRGDIVGWEDNQAVIWRSKAKN